MTPAKVAAERQEMLDLRAEVLALRKDKERLDWLIQYDNRNYKLAGPILEGEWVVWDQSNGLKIAGRGDSPRAAIDAAWEAKG